MAEWLSADGSIQRRTAVALESIGGRRRKDGHKQLECGSGELFNDELIGPAEKMQKPSALVGLLKPFIAAPKCGGTGMNISADPSLEPCNNSR
jgi:hypothetical protein